MRYWLASGCAAALVVVAACNSGEQSASTAPENQGQTAESAAANVANGSAGAVDIAAVMHARHEHYEEMGKAMKGIGDQLKAGSPDLSVVRRHAARIAEFGPQVLTWFPEGSGPEAGRTRAKAEIWSDAATFRQRAQQFEAQAANFNRTAQGNDVAAIRAAHGELGKTCKDCHDRFRGPELEEH
ncbi:MAG: cytochrome c [Pseudomonadota bacterium]|nr:cytochrome c [Pseudomonadota bacterium]